MTERSPAIELPICEAGALRLDSSDPAPSRREAFWIPPGRDGGEVAYGAGNSLGLQPRVVREAALEVLDDWRLLGVEGHVRGPRPWIDYHLLLQHDVEALVGAAPGETVAMGSLTANLHLLLATFYRPTPTRHRIVVEAYAFPSDLYVVDSQARHHGFEPAATVVALRPRDGEDTLRTEDVVAYLERQGQSVALVLLGGVNYLTGELFDIPEITRAGHAAGAVVGWDLAHAAGNVPLSLHDWDVDFAAWCSYKYLNAGPGATAGCYVHARHGQGLSEHRLTGWWGHERSTRFAMPRDFRAAGGADGWQVSNPAILAMAALRASLTVFAEAGGIPILRQRSERLTAYLERLLDDVARRRSMTIITPRDPARRGAQLSVRVTQDADTVVRRMSEEHDVVCDARQPDVVRIAPVPLYTTFHDVWRFAAALEAVLGERT